MLTARYILSTTGSTVISGGLQLALTVLAARLLVPEQNGHYAQFILIFNLAFIGLNFGLGPASTFFIASGRASARDVRRANVAVLIGLALLLGALSGLAYWTGFVQTIELTLKIPAALLYIGTAAGLVFLSFSQILAILMGGHRYDTVNALNVARAALPLIVVVGWALVGVHSAASISVAHAVGLALALVVSIKVMKTPSAPRGGIAESGRLTVVLRNMLGYGALVYFSNLLHYLAMRGLLLLLSYYSAPESVGFLSLALLLLEVTLLLPSAIGQLVFPQASSKNFDRAVIEVALRLNLYVSMLLVVLIVALAAPLVSLLMGASYAPVAHALIHLAPSVVLLAIPRILSQLLSGQGHPRYPLFAAAVSLVLGVALAVWAIPQWGVVGAAWVTNLVSAITAIITVIGYCRVHHVTASEVLLPRRQDWAGVRRLVALRMGR